MAQQPKKPQARIHVLAPQKTVAAAVNAAKRHVDAVNAASKRKGQ